MSGCARAPPSDRGASTRRGRGSCPHADRLLLTVGARDRPAAVETDVSRRSRRVCIVSRRARSVFRLAGQIRRAADRGEHIVPVCYASRPAYDTPAEVVTELGEILRQTPIGIALTGDRLTTAWAPSQRRVSGFTDPPPGAPAPEGRAVLSRVYAAGLRALITLRGHDSRAAALRAAPGAEQEFRARGRARGGQCGPPRSTDSTTRRSALDRVRDAARPGPVAPAPGVHRGSGQREKRKTSATGGHRRANPPPERGPKGGLPVSG